jgi:hypothetical protein
MPEEIQPLVFSCRGGLVLNKSSFEIPSGAAVKLLNFEPSIEGGYRRINGFALWNSTEVPFVLSATEKVLMSAIFGSSIIAARGTAVYTATASSAWTTIDSARTGAGRYSHERYNFNGTDKLVFCDGTNYASTWDGSTIVDLNGVGSPTAPEFIAIFKNHIFFADSTTNTVTFTTPFSEADFATGGGTLKVDAKIVGLKVYRDDLYIFADTRIYKLSGSSVSDFVIVPITRNIGCLNGRTIQEFAGDLVFLAPDGLRNIRGTTKIDDVDLGTISEAVRPRFKEHPSPALFESVVIPNKTQYRLFFCNSTASEINTKGLMLVMQKPADYNPEGYEFSDLKGIKPSCTDYDILGTDYVVIHGGYDGYIYQQEVGITFNGVAINATYRSPDLMAGDPGMHKDFTHILVNYTPETTISASIYIRYDYEVAAAVAPDPYPLVVTTVVSPYGAVTYGTGVYGGASDPLLRQPIEGSGFAVAVRVTDSGATSGPFTLRGFQLEYTPGARR